MPNRNNKQYANGSGYTQRFFQNADGSVSMAVTADNEVLKVAATTAITRPADTTAYASGDLVANSVTAGSVVALIFAMRSTGGSGKVRRVRLSKDGTVLTNAAFRLHLYTTVPTVTNGDNGAWLSTQAATWIGSLDVTIDKAMSDGSVGVGIPTTGTEISFQLAATGTSLYGLLEARGAYTPTSGEVFTPTLEVWPS